MTEQNNFDVIIVGGSYAGLAAGMALGRALRKVLIIDNGKPCNRQTPYSHNFLTNDGKTPAEIAAVAHLQVSSYQTIEFFNGTATGAHQTANGFKIQVAPGETFTTKKLIFATGIRDILPDIEGLAACWGISVIHCPYCHGYEVRNEKTGILGNGYIAFDFARLISNWTGDLTLYTNGASTLTDAQRIQLHQHQISTIEKEIDHLVHENGRLRHIHFKDGSMVAINVIYAPGSFEQHSKIPEALGCRLTEEGYIQIDNSHETTVPGVYAIGDNSSKMRTVANAVAMGTAIGITVSKNMILEEF
jgi:thioredoxin reductase